METDWREDNENWYVDLHTGLGEGIYPKDQFTLGEAIYDQHTMGQDAQYLPKIIGCVAHFNADAYLVETSSQEVEIIYEILKNGIYEITDEGDSEDAALRLGGDENTFLRIYRAGDCILGELR